MTNKQIDREAGRIFAPIIPNNYAVRSQEDQEDFGIDYELELTDDNDQPTGFVFKVQQKGTVKATLIKNDTLVSFSEFTVAKVKYYLKFPMPVVLVVVDVPSRRAWWTMLQGNTDVLDAYDEAVKGGKTTMTVHLPTANALPATFDKMVAAVAEAQKWVTLESLKTAPPPDLLKAAVRDADLDASVESFTRNKDLFHSEQIERWLKEGKYDDGFKRSEAILNSPSETLTMRFAAGMNLMRIEPVRTIRDHDPNRDAKIIALRCSVTTQLFQLAKEKGVEPRRLRLFSVFLLRAARLHKLVQKHFGLSLSLTAQSQTGNLVAHAVTQNARIPVTAAIVSEARHMEKHLLWFLKKKQFNFFAPAWIRLVGDMLPFLTMLKTEGETEISSQLSEWLQRTGEIAIDISTKTKNWHEVAACASQSVSLAPDLHDPASLNATVEKARTIINGIEDESIRNHALEGLGKVHEQLRTVVRSDEDYADMYRNMAAAAGIDLSDETDRDANIINIGIKDLNPERALKPCRHLLVELGAVEIPGQLLGLPTAGTKTLTCTRFGFSVGALSLDDAYAQLHARHCATCEHAAPHPAKWKWSPEWQEHQERLHRKGGNSQ